MYVQSFFVRQRSRKTHKKQIVSGHPPRKKKPARVRQARLGPSFHNDAYVQVCRDTGRRMSAVGVDRKWLAEGQTDAIDPKPKCRKLTTSRQALDSAWWKLYFWGTGSSSGAHGKIFRQTTDA